MAGELLDAFGPLDASQIERPHGLARGQRPGEPVDAVQHAVVTRDAVKRRLRATGPQRHQRRGGAPGAASSAAASASMVPSSANTRYGTSRPRRSLTSASMRTASSESPPSASKRVLTPICCPENIPAQISAIAFSEADRGGTCSTASRRSSSGSMPSLAANPTRWSLPVGPFGISSRKRITRGTLKAGRRWPAHDRNSETVTEALARTSTAAPISSPSCACATAKHTACLTAGWASSTSSTSRGEIFSPPRLISSLRRPVRRR